MIAMGEADSTIDAISPELRLAIGYTPTQLRNRIAVVFALDRRLARIVSQANEPMLAQMRIAWWRDELGKPPGQRPAGDAVLDAAGSLWAGREFALHALIDGWENLLAEAPLPQHQALGFAAGRAAPFLSLMQDDELGGDAEAVALAARRWSLADLSAHVSTGRERTDLVALGRANGLQPARLPAAFRGLAVLDALARRSLKRGGRPLMEGRGAALTALRAGLLGA